MGIEERLKKIDDDWTAYVNCTHEWLEPVKDDPIMTRWSQQCAKCKCWRVPPPSPPGNEG